jgi:hypothetical protein
MGCFVTHDLRAFDETILLAHHHAGSPMMAGDDVMDLTILRLFSM